MGHAKPASLVLVISLLIFSGGIAEAQSRAPKASSQTIPVQSSQNNRQSSWGIGLMAWPEDIPVTDRTGRSFDATAQFYTPSLHYSQREYRMRDGIAYEGYAFFGKADIGINDNLVYFQKRVTLYGAGASVGWFYRPESKQVNIGFSAPFQMRIANWTDPEGGSVGKRTLLALGAALDARWRITPDIEINQRLAGYFGIKGAQWMINVGWTL